MAYKDPEVQKQKAREWYQRKKTVNPAWYEECKRRAREAARRKRKDNEEYRQTNREYCKQWRIKNPIRAKTSIASWYKRKSQDQEWLERNRAKQRELYHLLSEKDRKIKIQKQVECYRRKRVKDPAWHEEEKRRAREWSREKAKDPAWLERRRKTERRSRRKRRQDPEIRRRHAEDSSRHQRKCGEWLNSIKAERGCKHCDESDPVALVFHHKDPATKEFTISNHRSRSKERLLKEIAKCDVLCANCHRKGHRREL